VPQSGIVFFISIFTKVRYLLIILLALAPAISNGQKTHFTASKNCVQAYEDLISFRLAAGRKKLSQEIKADPYNRMIIVLQNYEDFIQLTFADDPALYKRRKSFKEKRLDFLTNSNKKSPYYRLSKGIIHLQWSLIHIKYKENWKAANDFRKANSYFKENKKLFPKFKETDIFYGAQKTIIGTVPNSYKWISNLIGLRGNMKLGMQLLRNSIAARPKLFKHDAIFYYIFLNEIVLNDSKKALRLLKTYNVDIKNNYLYTFMASNLMLNNFRAKEVIPIIRNRNKSSAYLQPIIFDYALGSAYLHQLQYAKAIPYLKKYLQSKSYFYKKDAALKIAYAYYLSNNKLANVYKAKIAKVGTIITDMDKQAQKVYKQKNFGNKSLLKARLLFDGGSFAQSIQTLENTSIYNKLKPLEKLEWNYRLARVYDESRKINQAIAYYKKTLTTSNPTKEYYPARAALQLAFIYEKLNKKSLATKYFQKVLAIDGHEYKSSLDHKAKSGILRIQGK